MAGEGSGLRKWRRMDGTTKGSPPGVDRDVRNVEGRKGSEKRRGKRRQKRHMARGYRVVPAPDGTIYLVDINGTR